MTGQYDGCFGCGAPVKGTFHLCERCQNLVGVGPNGEPTNPLPTDFNKRMPQMNEAELVRYIQKGLFFKSFVFAGLTVSIILAHPALAFLRTVAHKICLLTSSCPLA